MEEHDTHNEEEMRVAPRQKYSPVETWQPSVMLNEIGEPVTIHGSSPWRALRLEVGSMPFGEWNRLTGETRLRYPEALEGSIYSWEEIQQTLADRTMFPLWPRGTSGCAIVFPAHVPDIDW